MTKPPPTLRWSGGTDGHLVLLDQTRLPGEVVELACRNVEDVWEAIRSLRVRGAPAIGIAAAYAVVLAATEKASVLAAIEHLATSRPTAVNLFWALERMRAVANSIPPDRRPQQLAQRLLDEARQIHDEDRQQCATIGRHGALRLAELPDGAGILTHCNAGALATGGEGTALAVIFALHAAGKRPHVFVDETRPLLQGARLTTWELQQRGIRATLICDSMAAQVMREGCVDAVITGADRIAASGDTANKIGTYSVAVAADAHQIPFYIAAPTTTFDLSLECGEQIPIEERLAEEITCLAGTTTAPAEIDVYNPAFDVTPARLIRAIICEKGVIEPVTASSVRQHTVPSSATALQSPDRGQSPASTDGSQSE
jgi:methylthioribose-1-phosphate isomerase